MQVMRRHEADFAGGVVHSFDGSLPELQSVLQMDKLSIGINVSHPLYSSTEARGVITCQCQWVISAIHIACGQSGSGQRSGQLITITVARACCHSRLLPRHRFALCLSSGLQPEDAREPGGDGCCAC